jgi:hypothetical protein
VHVAGDWIEILVLPGDLPAQLANEGNKSMNGINVEQREEEILACEVSDEALEAAAGTVTEKAGSFTLSFCSGLDTCPT